MTTGSRITGSYVYPSGFFSARNWSGADGASLISGYVRRPGYFRYRYAWKSIKGVGRVLVPVSRTWIQPRPLVKRTRSHLVWHNYTAMNKVESWNWNVVKSPDTGNVESYYCVSADAVTWSGSPNSNLTLQSRLVEAIKGHSFNLAVASAESPQTVLMIAGTVRRITKSITHLRKGDIPSALRVLGATPKGRHSRTVQPPLTSRDASSMWLELQYGWMPLLQDVHGAASALAAQHRDPRVTTFVSSFNESKHFHTRLANNFDKHSVTSVRKRILAELKENMSVARTLGLADPLSVAWELTPFSFVADWFLPIGDYLSNLNALPTLTGRFCTTVRITREGTCQGLGRFPSGKPSTASCHAAIKIVDFSRTISSGIPPALPEFKNPVSLGHLENSLALLVQAVSFKR